MELIYAEGGKDKTLLAVEATLEAAVDVKDKVEKEPEEQDIMY